MEDIFFNISVKDWSEVIRNYVLTGTAICTVIIAWRGLDSWKKQKVWNHRHSLVREVLQQVYRDRDWVRNYRSRAVINMGSLSGSTKELNVLDSLPEVKHYKANLPYISDMLTNWEKLLFLCKIEFGSETFGILLGFQGEVLMLISWYHPFILKVFIESHQDDFDLDRALAANVMGIFKSSHENDALDNRIDVAISNIEKNFQSYLGRRK